MGTNPDVAGIDGKKADGASLVFLLTTNTLEVGTIYVGASAVYTPPAGASTNDVVNIEILDINGTTITFKWSGGAKIIAASGIDGYTAVQSAVCGN